ncbi:unnamed protein product [Closterium sp. NIES-54]
MAGLKAAAWFAGVSEDDALGLVAVPSYVCRPEAGGGVGVVPGEPDLKIGHSKLPLSPFESEGGIPAPEIHLKIANGEEVFPADSAVLLDVKKRIEAEARAKRTYGSFLHRMSILGADPEKEYHRFSNRTETMKENNYQINYYGGAVLTQPINLYIIYYGTWYQSEVNIVENFIKSISSTSYTSKFATVRGWWKMIASRYYQISNGQYYYITPKVKLAGTAYDKYTSSSIIGAIERQIMTTKRFPLDANGIYMVLTSADVTVTIGGDGFCDRYCGLRTAFTGIKNGVSKLYQYIHVGNPIRQCADSSCVLGQSEYYYKTPNGNWGVDSMIATIGHELAEAATEPDLEKGWHDETGMEVGDKCSADLGAKVWVANKDTKNSYLFNTVGLNGVRFLQEAIWNYSPKSCVVQ